MTNQKIKPTGDAAIDKVLIDAPRRLNAFKDWLKSTGRSTEGGPELAAAMGELIAFDAGAEYGEAFTSKELASALKEAWYLIEHGKPAEDGIGAGQKWEMYHLLQLKLQQ